jgi:hypothetical protein
MSEMDRLLYSLRADVRFPAAASALARQAPGIDPTRYQDGAGGGARPQAHPASSRAHLTAVATAEAIRNDFSPIVSPSAASNQASWTGLMWKNDGQFNEAGHRRVADVLRPMLADQLRSSAGKRAVAPP